MPPDIAGVGTHTDFDTRVAIVMHVCFVTIHKEPAIAFRRYCEATVPIIYFYIIFDIFSIHNSNTYAPCAFERFISPHPATLVILKLIATKPLLFIEDVRREIVSR